jgi:hypothetical protein
MIKVVMSNCGCQIPDEETVTHQIGSTLSGTIVPPDGMGENYGTNKVREVIYEKVL